MVSHKTNSELNKIGQGLVLGKVEHVNTMDKNKGNYGAIDASYC